MPFRRPKTVKIAQAGHSSGLTSRSDLEHLLDAMRSAILLISCPDQMGLVAQVTSFLHRHNGNILGLDQHVDAEQALFVMRLEWELEGFKFTPQELAQKFQQEIARPLDMQWTLHFSDERPRMAVFVSKQPHCLYDILARCRSGEWDVELPLIVSNHVDLEPVARELDIEFRVFPITPANKNHQEAEQLKLLAEHEIDFIVLARYMQILTDQMMRHYPNRIINIHHSFLPAFPGLKPYHSAHERGVKIIGATSHYVTTDLDAGPIIAQDVVHVSHNDSVADFVRKGRDLEKIVLARAIWQHLRRKVLVCGNRTVVFT
jgi:formyltetrahydrofolate deformylase